MMIFFASGFEVKTIGKHFWVGPSNYESEGQSSQSFVYLL